MSLLVLTAGERRHRPPVILAIATSGTPVSRGTITARGELLGGWGSSETGKRWSRTPRMVAPPSCPPPPGRSPKDGDVQGLLAWVGSELRLFPGTNGLRPEAPSRLLSDVLPHVWPQ